MVAQEVTCTHCGETSPTAAGHPSYRQAYRRVAYGIDFGTVCQRCMDIMLHMISTHDVTRRLALAIEHRGIVTTVYAGSGSDRGVEKLLEISGIVHSLERERQTVIGEWLDARSIAYRVVEPTPLSMEYWWQKNED